MTDAAAAKPKTGTARIIWGIVLLAVGAYLLLGTLINGAGTAILFGLFFAAIPLVIGLLFVVTGAEQRKKSRVSSDA